SMNNDKSDYGSMSREHYDLASAVNATKELSGTNQDDVFTWEPELRINIELYKLNETGIKRLIISKVRGKAQTYMAAILKEQPWLTPEELFVTLKKQFSNTEITHEKLNQFLRTHVASERSAYYEMLDLADDLFQRKAINEQSLIKLNNARCPP
ncbi:hypothetical protein COBT_003066, partial [Conglomerata obtusa]